MAQTGYTPILIYSSSTTTNAPTVGNLTNSTLGSELAINITDGKLFYKDNANAIQVIGWKTVPATAGGTGQTVYVVGDILYANTTTTLARLADVATGNALISGGVGVAPSWGKIGLTTHISGVLPIANGGTNASTASITSFNNITGYTASGATGTTSTNLVFSTSPTLITPALGTPSALVLTNATGLPQTGFGTNVAGNGPAFSASLSGNQTVNTGTTTKLTFNTEQFDTNSNYDNATNYRFTPTVAGYYQINVALSFSDVGVGTQDVLLRLYKNGAQYLQPIRRQTGAGNEVGITLPQLISMNGSSDYLEVYFQVAAATNCVVYTGSNFSGSLARAA